MKKLSQEQIFGIIRHVLTFTGGILVIKGVATDAVTNEIIGSTMSLIGLVWSVVSKKTPTDTPTV